MKTQKRAMSFARVSDIIVRAIHLCNAISMASCVEEFFVSSRMGTSAICSVCEESQVQSTSKLDQFFSSHGLGHEVCRIVVSRHFVDTKSSLFQPCLHCDHLQLDVFHSTRPSSLAHRKCALGGCQKERYCFALPLLQKLCFRTFDCLGKRSGERRGTLEERRGQSQCIGLIRWLIASVAFTQRAHCQ